MIAAGERAPAFVAQSTQGEFSLTAQILPGGLVLFFFPKIATPG